MKNTRTKFLIKVLVSLSLVVFLISKMDFSTLASLNKIRLSIMILMAASITCFSLLFMSLRWKLLLLNYLNQKIPFILAFKWYLIGMFFNIFLPGSIGGDVIRTKKVIDFTGSKLSRATTITITERVFGFLGLAIIGLSGLLISDLPPAIDNVLDFPSTIWIIGSIVSLAILGLVAKKFLRNRFSIKATDLVGITAISVIAQLGDVTIAWILSHSFSIGVQFSEFLLIMPIVFIATVLPISLGGLGVREGTFAGLLALFQVETSVAISIAFLMYLAKVLVGLAGGIIYLKD